ncbi:hypothetical protein BC30052_2701 [Bacillus cereus]|nr:hypothetical protein BCM0074_2611 [Bacillus cereus]BCD05646.1 hypothetical protein BC30052_2701 [Bacillus cereus]
MLTGKCASYIPLINLKPPLFLQFLIITIAVKKNIESSKSMKVHTTLVVNNFISIKIYAIKEFVYLKGIYQIER